MILDVKSYVRYRLAGFDFGWTKRYKVLRAVVTYVFKKFGIDESKIKSGYCPICGRKTKRFGLIRHLRRHEEEVNYIASEVRKIYELCRSVLKTYGSRDKIRYVCTLCNSNPKVKFKKVEDFVHHVITVHYEKS